MAKAFQNIPLDANTKKDLDRIKKKLDARSYDDTVAQLIEYYKKKEKI